MSESGADKRDDELRQRLETLLARRRRFRPSGPLGLLLLGGTVGLLLVVPPLLGAYLGRWLDGLMAGYSVRWTVSLIVLGIALGAYNAYRFLQGLDR